jgi:hypothetical protein
MSELPRANVRVFRIVAAAWLVGWFWKAWFFAGYYFGEIWAHPFRYAGLPRVLVHPALAAIAWAAPVLVLGALAYPRAWMVRAAAVLMTLAAFAACLHFETFSDATFVTSFWVGLWLVWFTANASRTDAALYLHARALAQCILALVFLGGAVGKLTSEYTSGEAFYQLYFVQKDSWPYPWLRDALSADALRTLATWFSRVVIAGEIALALSPLYPYRIAAIGGSIAIAGIVVISTWNLLSVMACLIGLLLALVFVDGERDHGAGDGMSSAGGMTPSRGL